MIIDPLGMPLYHKNNEADIFSIALDKESLNDIRATLPFLKDKDDFIFQDFA